MISALSLLTYILGLWFVSMGLLLGLIRFVEGRVR